MFNFRHSLYNNAYGGSGGNPYGTDFAIRVKTDNVGTSANNQFTIPTAGSGYDYNITTDEHNLTNQTGSVTLTFSTAGEYDIRISGTFPTILFNNGGDKVKLIYTYNFGDVGWSSLAGSFYGCVNNVIDASCSGNFENVTALLNAFRANSSLTFFPAINLPNATSFRSAFRETSLLEFPDIDLSSGLDFQGAWFNIGTMSSFKARNFYAMNNGLSCFQGTTLPTSDYSDILITQNANNPNNSVNFHGGNSNYDSSATSARANLVSTKLWSITDAGLI